LIGLLAVLFIVPAAATVSPVAPHPAAPAAIIRVPDDAASIQAAIEMAADGDEVRVQSGSYYERLVVTKTLSLTGGWDADYASQTTELTIVDSGRSGRGLTVRPGAMAPAVVISNFVFVHGDATGLGGVVTPTVPTAPTATVTLAQAADSSARAADLRAGLLKLAAQGEFPGGPAALDAALARVDALMAAAQDTPSVGAAQPANGAEIDCGGGIYVTGARLNLIKVYVNNSTASRTGAGAGGGLCAVDVPALTLEHVSMKGNTASQASQGYGGALFFSASQPVSRSLSLTDAAFRENIASLAGNGYGGALFISGAPEARFNLAVLTANTATSGGLSGFGGALYLIDSGGVTLDTVAFQLNNANTNLVVANPTEDWLTGMGGALYARSAPDLTLISGPNQDDPHSIFVGNIAALKGLGRGGALYAEDTPRLHSTRIRFLGNWAVVYPAGQGEFIGGGALYLSGAEQAQLEDNDFNNNIAGVFGLEDFKLSGGAIGLASSDRALISGNRFLENASGTAAQGGDAMGGAIDIAYSDAVIVRDNIFTGNVADLGPSGGIGGAVHAQRVNDILIHHNSFVRNRAGTRAGIGGALTLEVSRPDESWNGFTAPRGLTDTLNNRVTISANTFRENVAALDQSGNQALLGGAMAFNSVNGVTLTNNVVANNTARSGAGLALLGWDVTKIAYDTVRNAWLGNNTLVNNAGENGVYMEMWTTPITLTNNIVVSHTVGLHAHTNPTLGGMTAEVRYTVYNDNTTNSEADEESALTETGVITGPVRFVDRWQGNYRLQVTSAARDAGDPAGVPPAPAVDIEGTRRPFGRAVDVGAYEWHGTQVFLPMLNKTICPDYSGWAAGNAFGGYGMIIHTTNGGCTWSRQGDAGVLGPGDLSGVAAADARTAWVVGANGVILHTTDGGITWQRQALPADVPVTAAVGNNIKLVDRNTLWTMACTPGGASYILKTVDGGAHWVTQAEIDLTPGCFSHIDAFDAQYAWVVGGHTAGLSRSALNDNSGVIFSTTDGGQHWTRQADQEFTLIDVAAVSPTLGWISGKGSTLLRTQDGGANWQSVDPGMGGADLNRLFTVNGNDVWIAGDNSMLLHTTNGLATADQIRWQKHEIPVGALWLMTITFVDPQIGWLTNMGANGPDPTSYVFITDNGGRDWSSQPVPANGGFWNLVTVKN
jgi:photosystem II stability/assembly factor-like uncharacterized protein